MNDFEFLRNINIGQYLQPTKQHLPVAEFVHPDRFKAFEEAAYGLGFTSVFSGPLVRSSYHADEFVPPSGPR